MAPYVVRGKVVGRTGAPVSDATVYFVQGPGALPEIAALTGADGSFSLTAPLAGEFVVGCSAPDGGSARLSLHVPTESALEFVLDV